MRLIDADGDLLATEVTDGTGRAAFAARAGSTYTVEAPAPKRWITTTAARRTVTAPAAGGPASVEVGHHHTVDQVAPRPPTITPGSGPLRRPATVALGAETGATVRYTLDGTTPTATRGMPYHGPVLVATDTVLRTVAVDASGNTSDVAAAQFDLPWRGRATTVAGHWLTTLGRARAAGAGVRAHVVAAAPAGEKRRTDSTATVLLPRGYRTPAALTVSMSLRASLRRTPVTVLWYDAHRHAWLPLLTAEAGLDRDRWDVALPGTDRAVGRDGTVRLRITSEHAEPYDLEVEGLTVGAVDAR